MTVASSICFLCVFAYMNAVTLGQGNQSVSSKIHCVGSNELLQINDPFPSSFDDDKLISMEWRFYSLNESEAEQTGVLIFQLPSEDSSIKNPRWELFEHWGLQLQEPKFEDSGLYKATMVTLTKTVSQIYLVKLTVAEAPVLKSRSLAVSRGKNKETGEVTLNCGTLASLGKPPVQLIWRTPNGTVVEGMYKNGNITLGLSNEEGDGTYSCEVKEPAAALTCVPPEDLERWDETFKFDRHLNPSESTSIFLIVIVCVVIVVVIAIILIIILAVKRKKHGEVYNAKDEEERADKGQNGGGEQAYPLVIQDDANPYDKPNASASMHLYANKDRPANPSGHTASPYMVSGLNLPPSEREQTELPPKKKKMSGTALDNIDIAGRDKGNNGKPSGRYNKRGENRDPKDPVVRSDSDSKDPPMPKKRSIFLTESNEALDKITEAVAGGKGSGADGGRARKGESSV